MQQSHQLIWQLSQAHLNLLESCSRKFQHRYLDRLDTSVGFDNTLHQQLGKQFHQLMQQQALGLEIAPLMATDHRLQDWFQAFAHFPPPMITGECLSEHQRLYWQHGYLLVAIYDLLIQNSNQAQILDWKTYALPRRADHLRQDWQTRLYLYLLAETSDYCPEQLSMTYWFAEASTDQPASTHYLSFAYTQSLHEQTQQDLAQILSNLNQELLAYETGQAMQQVAVAQGKCETPHHRCEFAERCQRRLQEDQDLELQAALANIDGISECPIQTQDSMQTEPSPSDPRGG